MRRKYRVWDTQDNEMIYNAESTYDYGCGGVWICDNHFGEVLEDSRYIVMQCTGQKDSDGTLIYEDDYLKAEHSHGQLSGYVVWDDYHAAFGILSEVFVSFGELKNMGCSYKIAGNKWHV